MKCGIAFIAAIAAVQASPVPAPQGVTKNISPTVPAPSGCTVSWSGSFGIAVQNLTASGSKSVSQLSDVSCS